MMNLKNLAEPFPNDAVHWRPQKLFNRNGGWVSMALAYLDARDVQDRLDDVCGPEGWQVAYTETPRGKTIASIGIKVGDEWVWKSDGAGDTDIEGDKGGISDAFKRAAVPWGIGRYLYRLGAPWVKCEVNSSNGKDYFKKWLEDPWSKVATPPTPMASATQQAREDAVEDRLPENANPRQKAEAFAKSIIADIEGKKSEAGVEGSWKKWGAQISRLQDAYSDLYSQVFDAYQHEMNKFKEEE